ncbi:hypothetical protein ACQ86D_32025 [Streptomyces galilaeus]
MGDLGYVQWTCDDDTVCGGITECHLDKRNPSGRAYDRASTVASSKSPLCKAHVPLVRGDTTSFQEVGK